MPARNAYASGAHLAILGTGTRFPREPRGLPPRGRPLMRPPTRFAVRYGNLDTALRYRAVLDLVTPVWQSDAEVLEIGSGAGGVTEFLEHPVTGVDIAFDRTADRGTSLLTPVVASADHLPFRDERFDIVLCLEMLEHLPSQGRAAAVSEMVRVLHPGGRLVLTFPSGATAAALDHWLNEAFKRRRGCDHPWVIEHIQSGLPDSGEVAREVQRAAGSEGHVAVHWHMSPRAFRVVQGLYSIGWGGLAQWTVGLRSRLVATALFRHFAAERTDAAYRAIVVLDKAR